MVTMVASVIKLSKSVVVMAAMLDTVAAVVMLSMIGSKVVAEVAMMPVAVVVDFVNDSLNSQRHSYTL